MGAKLTRRPVDKAAVSKKAYHYSTAAEVPAGLPSEVRAVGAVLPVKARGCRERNSV